MATLTCTLPVARQGDNLIVGWNSDGTLDGTLDGARPTVLLRVESEGDELLTPDQLRALAQTGVYLNVSLKYGTVSGRVTEASSHRVVARVDEDQLQAALGKKPLPDSIGVLYDREHTEGVGGFHADPEDGGMWVECATGGGSSTKTLLSERSLRASGYDVPEFTGTPCPRCFPQEQGE